MRILHVNIRASQGGAGRVAMDLHQRLLRRGVESSYIYGYSSGVEDDPLVAGDPNIIRIGTKPCVLTNYIVHRLIGRDIWTGHADILSKAIASTDVIHLHCPHHYYMNWLEFVRLARLHDKPVIVTTHDWWFLTGRCGFVESCTGWRRTCGECGQMRHRDLPSLVDLSRRNRTARVASIRSLGSAIRFACPSVHIAEDYRLVYPTTAIDIIPNTFDLVFEEGLDTAERPVARRGLVCSASDLTSPGKVDRIFLERVLRDTHVPISFVGRNSPFVGPRVTNFGEIRSRNELARILLSAKGLIFTSRMDNAPLTIMEALAAGCYVIAYNSPAANEILSRVGGRCVRDPEEAIALIQNDSLPSLFGGVDHAALEARARKEFAGSIIVDQYMRLYQMAGSAHANAGTKTRPELVEAEQ